MTTPTLSPFHQKIFPHAKSAKVPADIYLTKNNPFRLYPDWAGALRPLRSTARPGNAGREPSVPQSPTTNFPFRLLHPWRPLREACAFTLIELLAVITIIGILAGLTLGAAGAVRRHGATSTAKTEVAALQAACDRYYADYNAYPTTNSIPNPSSSFNPNNAIYTDIAKVLFTNLVGSTNLTAAPTSKRYFEPKPAMVFTNTSPNYFIDPWGYAYGYNSDGKNAPLIWSTAGQTTGGANTNKWITSWPKM